MKRMSGVKKYFAIIGLGALISAHPAQAYVWPTVDMTQIVNFINNISTQINKITTFKSEIDNTTKAIHTVGDQANAIRKYTANLKGTIASIQQNVTSVVSSAENLQKELEDKIEELENKINDSQEEQNANAEATVDSVEDQVDNDFEEDDVQNTITEGKTESENIRDEVNEKFDNAAASLRDAADKAIENIDKAIEAIDAAADLDEDEREAYHKEAEDLQNRMAEFEEEALSVINSAKEAYNEEYSAQIAAAFDEYSKAVSDYYNGVISREELTAAGEKFKESVAAVNVDAIDEMLNGLVDKAQNIVEDAAAFKENILDRISNSKEYSDDDEADDKVSYLLDTPQKYAFRYHSTNQRVYLSGLYAGSGEENKSFIMAEELGCQGLNINTFDDNLSKVPDKLRDCVTRAKTEIEYFCPGGDCDPFSIEPLYAPYRKNGVYKHLQEDYVIANIVNNARIAQYVNSWSDMENSSSTIKVMMKAMENIDNISDAYTLMSMIDIESPRLWSWIRRIDTLHRAKDVISHFQIGKTLYLDKRDEDFAEAVTQNPGKIKIELPGGETVEKSVFSNVFLYNCEIKGDDISVAYEDRQNKEKLLNAEKKAIECLFRFAEASSKGTISGKNVFEDIQRGIQLWNEKQDKSLNDSSFETLALATINNFKSTKDYEEPKNDTDMTIIGLQNALKEATVTRDDYAAGAQINYYATQQILSIVEADAQSLQTEILKDLKSFNYNYFGRQ